MRKGLSDKPDFKNRCVWLDHRWTFPPTVGGQTGFCPPTSQSLGGKFLKNALPPAEGLGGGQSKCLGGSISSAPPSRSSPGGKTFLWGDNFLFWGGRRNFLLPQSCGGECPSMDYPFKGAFSQLREQNLQTSVHLCSAPGTRYREPSCEQETMSRYCGLLQFKRKKKIGAKKCFQKKVMLKKLFADTHFLVPSSAPHL